MNVQNKYEKFSKVRQREKEYESRLDEYTALLENKNDKIIEENKMGRTMPYE